MGQEEGIRDQGLGIGQEGRAAVEMVTATLEWVCSKCCRVVRSWIPMDGRARQIDCPGCSAVGGMLIPTGPAMDAPESLETVECAECGATFSDRTHGCHRCRGELLEAAEGRVIA